MVAQLTTPNLDIASEVYRHWVQETKQDWSEPIVFEAFIAVEGVIVGSKPSMFARTKSPLRWDIIPTADYLSIQAQLLARRAA